MNRAIALIVLLWSVCFPMAAQVPSTDSSAKASTKPELERIVGEYEAQEKAIDAEIAPLIKTAGERYTADLENLISTFTQRKRLNEVDQVRKELKRFAARGLDGDRGSLPAEVRTPWTTFLRSVSSASQSVAIKRNSIRAKYNQALSQLEQGYRAKNDPEGIAAVRRARLALVLRSAIEANRIGITEIARKSGSEWQDVVKEGGFLVGFEVAGGRWHSHKVVTSLCPLYATAGGIREGQRRGGGRGARVLAKEGYAVGGVLVRGGAVVNCIQIIFHRIKPDGMSLDPQDLYTTDWLGGEGGGNPEEINTRGRMVVGVTGATERAVDSVGLIYLK